MSTLEERAAGQGCAKPSPAAAGQTSTGGSEPEEYFLRYGVLPDALPVAEEAASAAAERGRGDDRAGRQTQPPPPIGVPAPKPAPEARPRPTSAAREGACPPGSSGLPGNYQGERALFVGILNQGRLDYENFYCGLCRARERNARNLGERALKFAEVRRWLLSRDAAELTSFESLCQVLDLAPSVVRAGIIRRAEERELKRKLKAARSRGKRSR